MNNKLDNWAAITEQVKNKLNEQSFETWFKPVIMKKIDDKEIVLGVPNNFFKDWLNNNYIDILSDAVYVITGEKLEVKFDVEDDAKTSVDRVSVPPAIPSKNAIKKYNNRLNPRYTFDSFVVGSSNQLPHAASIAISSTNGSKFNPLFIYGGVGLGKTHLLHAIGNQILESKPLSRIIYMSSEEFMNEFIASLRAKQSDKFRKRFRENCDVLLIDDIQFISGKESTQDEFFHTFNALYERNKQIVLTSDKYPQEIPKLEERLRSRFQWGLIADIQAPEMETRLAILKQKADDEGIPLPNDVALYLATSIKSNVRELEGSLINLAAHASLENSVIDLDFATKTLRKVVALHATALTIANIQKAVCNHFNVALNELTGSRRHRSIAFPRQVAMYLCRKGLNSSFPEIGNQFGGKDHTTALAACRKIEKQLSSDASIRGKIEALERSLGF